MPILFPFIAWCCIVTTSAKNLFPECVTLHSGKFLWGPFFHKWPVFFSQFHFRRHTWLYTVHGTFSQTVANPWKFPTIILLWYIKDIEFKFCTEIMLCFISQPMKVWAESTWLWIKSMATCPSALTSYCPCGPLSWRKWYNCLLLTLVGHEDRWIET